MVSTRSLLQTVLVIATTAVATAAPQPDVKILTVPYMPRIPSAARHAEGLRARSLEADPTALADVTCLDASQDITIHDEAVAQLSICGGMSGAVTKCEGGLTVTVGEKRTARFVVNAVDEGASVDISKENWVRCVQAARAQCPSGSLKATCVGGGSTGDVAFTLENPQIAEL